MYSQGRISVTKLTLNYTMISLFCFLPASDGAYEVFQSNSRQLGLRWRKLWPETIRFKLSDNHIFLPYIHVGYLEGEIKEFLGFDAICVCRRPYEMYRDMGVLCLRCFLRLWKNNRVSRKPCKRRSDLVLNGKMRVPK